MGEKQKNRGWKHVANAAKLTVAAVALSPVVAWTDRTTEHFTHIPHKDKNVSAAGFDPALVGAGLRERMLDVILGYDYRDGGKSISSAEIDYGKSFGRDLRKDFEVLDEMRTDHGFYGVLVRDKINGRTSLAIAGMDYSGSWGAMFQDLDDAFMSTAGGWTSQFPDAVAFAKHAQQVALEKTGKPIDYVTGHSLGAYLTTYLAAGDVLKGARYSVFDGPGVNTTLVDEAVKEFKLRPEQIEANLREHCDSFTFTHNTYNTLGEQPGRAVTVDNKAVSSMLRPEQHIYTDEFVGDVKRKPAKEIRSNNEGSPAPGNFIALFLACAALPFIPYGRGARAVTRMVRNSGGNEGTTR